MPSACDTFKDNLLDLDKFGEGFTFKLPNGKETTRTWAGVFCTMIIYALIVLYAGMKVFKVTNYGDSTIIQSISDSKFTADFKWTSSEDDGMQFAFGVTAYDSNQEPIDDPTYGRVVARYQTWGMGGEMGSGLSDPIPMKKCSR